MASQYDLPYTGNQVEILLGEVSQLQNAMPDKVSDLPNDAGYITSADLPTKTSDLTNDSGFITNAPVAAEAARAQAAEALLATISSLQAEITRATGVEGTLQGLIDGILAKIPLAASGTNQLADKSYVNASISTASATFRGTYNSLVALQAVAADENDYGYVISTDSVGNTIYNRYKYASGTWTFEYAIANPIFDSAQWAAINSAITSALVQKLSALPDNTALQAALAAKQNVIDDLATIRSGAEAGGTAYQKPAGGIPASDIADGVIPDVSGKVNTSDIADNLTTNDATKVLSAKQGKVLNENLTQLGQEVDTLHEGYTDLSATLSNAGFVRTTGAIASGTTYPNSRYSTPIEVHKGDVLYIKANVGSTGVSVISLCTQTGTILDTIIPGVNDLHEYRYIVRNDGYVILSTYKPVASDSIWVKWHSGENELVLDEKNISAHYGNNVWKSNPSVSQTSLDLVFSNVNQITRRMVYSAFRYVKFKGVEMTTKRTICLIWNGYSDVFRVSISKYEGGSWVEEFNTGNLDIAEINPLHNAVVPIEITSGEKSVSMLIDTALVGYIPLGLILNPLTSEPELIFADDCYTTESGTDTTDCVKIVSQNFSESQKKQARANIGIVDGRNIIPHIFPNALLPCVSFEFDDNDVNDDLVVALFDELGVRCNFAFIASEENLSAYGDKYLGWHRRGYGICSHSVDGVVFNTTNYTRETALSALMTSKNRLEKKGFVVNGFVSPSSQMDAEFYDLVQNTYGYAFTANDGYSGQRRGNPCRQSRQSMQSATLDYLKGRVDIAIAFGYNFTFYGHSANFGTTYSGEEWDIAKLRAIVEYAINKRNEGKIFIGNSDECMSYFYGENIYNENFSGVCGTIQPKDRHRYFLHDVESVTIAYNANLPAECEFLVETSATYTSGGITFGSGYKFNAVPAIGASETWHFKIVQGCIIATKFS